VYSAEVSDIEALSALQAFGLIRASSGSKQYVPSLSSSVRAIQADEVWGDLKIDGSPVDGTGTRVAIIDTGANWNHPSFWRTSAGEYDFFQFESDFYLDLDDDGNPDPGEGPVRAEDGSISPIFSYGSNYMFLDNDGSGGFDYGAGDRWIVGVDENDDGQIQLTDEPGMMLNISKIAVFYDQTSDDVYFRGVNLTTSLGMGDSNGHGTHVASTIAAGQPGFTSFVGVAPGADLIIIRSPLTSTAILDGISFAVEYDADVINLSFSSYLGFLDGTDLEDLAVNEAFLEHGIVSVAAAGNLGDKEKHSRFGVASASASGANVDVRNPPDYSFVSVLWHSDDRDEHVILTPPEGEEVDLGEFSSLAGTAFALNTDHLSAYVFAEISMRGMNNIIIQVQTGEHFWENGIWEVSVENPSGPPLTVDVYAWDGDWSSTNMQVATDIDYGHTISSPGTADLAITVAAYSEIGSTILSSSSRGPRIDGAHKPSLAAPGSNIYAANYRYLQGSLWSSKSGTSMASPHVAGAAALVFQCLIEENAWPTYSALLAGAGGNSSHFDSSSPLWGHGLCDSLFSVFHILNSTLASGATETEWSGLPELVADPDDSEIASGLDLLSAKALVHEEAIGFAITLEGDANFTDSNELSVEWDQDSNPSTGLGGIDVLVNLTGGSVTAYEWVGSAYEESEMSVTSWTESNIVFIRMNGIESGRRGSVSIATHNSTLSYVDQTNLVEIPDYFRPLFKDVVFSSDSENLNITLVMKDIDTTISEVTVGWDIVDGPLRSLASGMAGSVSEVVVYIEEQLLDSEYANSMLANVTSEENVFFSPLIPLSSLVGFRLQFTSGVLDQDVVSIGLLSGGVISGSFTLDGFNLAEDVYVAFRHQSSGFWLNFSLSSNDGVYDFSIRASSFSEGSYDVFAIAIGRGVPNTEMQFAMLNIVQDASMIVIGALVVGVVIALVIVKRYKGERIE
jgi:subtilisin family serine protease